MARCIACIMCATCMSLHEELTFMSLLEEPMQVPLVHPDALIALRKFRNVRFAAMEEYEQGATPIRLGLVLVSVFVVVY